ncbi:type I-E CRISPR-associated protein Cas7/Cse4/CasC (plasmid) [Streptomyces sp. NBC_00445]|uniref:type I-E CRISPR-associated protein Cas7/Cse4/CasC n=1 Tax=Streptomyces sp. NBC_00445 TaxID=2975745 RepID=UPI002E1F9EAF
MNANTATDLAPDPQAARAQIIDTTGAPGPFVAVHSLTPLHAVNLNQDMFQMPKQGLWGGVERMRVSSQALARAARIWVIEHAEKGRPTASRSRLLPQQTARRLQEKGIDAADAVPAAALIVAAAGVNISQTNPDRTRTVSLVPADAPDRLADVVLGHWEELTKQRAAMEEVIAQALAGKVPRKTKGEKAVNPAAAVPEAVSAAARRAFDPSLIDSIALFGRMLTELPDGTVPSSVQIAHALSVDPMNLITDDFTVRDDWQDHGVFGSAHIGQQYLASGTLYRFAALDRRELRLNLARSGADPKVTEQAAQEAERAFVTAIAYALPHARRSRTGSAVRPLLIVAASCDQPLTADSAFEVPVPDPVGPNAAERLARFLHAAGVRGGVARWHSPTNDKAPDLPGTLTIGTP